jgi:hypothetical protein
LYEPAFPREIEEDLDIPTFLRKEEKKAAVLDQWFSARMSAPGGRGGDAVAEFVGRINRRLDHAHSSIKTVATLDDMKRYGLPDDIAGQLEPLISEQCREDWLVAAFLNKLARHPRYEPLLSRRVRTLIQNYVNRFDVMCVQLETCIQPIVAKCA